MLTPRTLYSPATDAPSPIPWSADVGAWSSRRPALPYMTFRGTRHFFATKLAEAGAPEEARKVLMGHVSIGTTAGYAHWSPQTFVALVGKASHAIEQSAQVSAIG